MSDRFIAIEYPSVVCLACVHAYCNFPAQIARPGYPGPAWHRGICEICRVATNVTDPRSFGGLRDDLWKVKIEAMRHVDRDNARHEAPRTPYTILNDGKAIRCNTCRHTSHNINDVKQLYCGFCNAFHALRVRQNEMDREEAAWS